MRRTRVMYHAALWRVYASKSSSIVHCAALVILMECSKRIKWVVSLVVAWPKGTLRQRAAVSLRASQVKANNLTCFCCPLLVAGQHNQTCTQQTTTRTFARNTKQREGERWVDVFILHINRIYKVLFSRTLFKRMHSPVALQSRCFLSILCVSFAVRTLSDADAGVLSLFREWV